MDSLYTQEPMIWRSGFEIFFYKTFFLLIMSSLVNMLCFIFTVVYSVYLLIDGNFAMNMHRLIFIVVYILELAHKPHVVKAAMFLSPYIGPLLWADDFILGT